MNLLKNHNYFFQFPLFSFFLKKFCKFKKIFFFKKLFFFFININIIYSSIFINIVSYKSKKKAIRTNIYFLKTNFFWRSQIKLFCFFIKFFIYFKLKNINKYFINWTFLSLYLKFKKILFIKVYL